MLLLHLLIFHLLELFQSMKDFGRLLHVHIPSLHPCFGTMWCRQTGPEIFFGSYFSYFLHGFPFSGSKDIGILIIVLWVPFHFVPNSENAHSFNILHHLSFHYNLIFLHPQEMCCFCCSLPFFDNASLENVLINWYELLTYRIFWPVFDNMGKMLHLPYFLLALEHGPFILHWMQYAHD